MKILGVTSGCSGGSLLPADSLASSFASCKRTLVSVIPVKVQREQKGDTF